MRFLTIIGLLLTISLQLSAAPLNPNILSRGQLNNSRLTFSEKKSGTVAFIGGSITEMNGYRPMVTDWLSEQFPNTKFNFIPAGIASTCSTTGAFRLQNHVLRKGPIDLFFIEFAVNDDQDARHTQRDSIRGMEGIIRQTRETNPLTDIVVTYFVNPGMLRLIQEGKTPLPIAAHEAVLKHYNISAIYLAKEVADQISAGTLTWKQFGGTHPAKTGNALAANLIAELLEHSWHTSLAKSTKPAPHPVPPTSLDPQSYFDGDFLSPSEANASPDWSWTVPKWKQIPGSFRSTFANQKLLTGTKPGAETSIKFSGRAIGAYVLAGPDAGVIETSIDGGPFSSTNLFHRFSRGLHYPRTVMFATNLTPGPHKLTFRMAKDSNDDPPTRQTARILQFTVNQ